MLFEHISKSLLYMTFLNHLTNNFANKEYKAIPIVIVGMVFKNTNPINNFGKSFIDPS